MENQMEKKVEHEMETLYFGQLQYGGFKKLA